jgi:high-affinity iron transporter
MRIGLIAGVLSAALGALQSVAAQEHPVRRVFDIVSVAISEYERGVDSTGRLISQIEYQEATDFLAVARTQAARLPGPRGAAALVILDSIVDAVGKRVPPATVKAIELAEGRQLYENSCASCHGIAGKGDGPAGRGMNPAPPAIGDANAMSDVSPATMYRIVSVGIGGTPMPAYGATMTPEQRWNIVSYLLSLRATPKQIAEGEGLYTQGCVQCHGVLGAGDGVSARALSRAPQEIGAFAWQAARNDLELSNVVRAGMPGTAMPPASHLTPEQARNVVAYLRTMPLKTTPVAVVDRGKEGDARAAAGQVLSLLEQSLAAARGGRTSDAADRAFDAYIAFEPMETRARARKPGLIANMEKQFADFRGAVRNGDTRAAERARDVIEERMPSVVDLTRPTGSGIEAFWQSFLIIFREGLEAILVIGAIVAFLLKTGHRERLRSIWWGVGLGLAASAVTAVVLVTILLAMPATREIIEGVTMLIAVAVLFSVSYWLISKVEAAKWQQFIQEKVTIALEKGGGRALAFVAFLAVYREGAETALFYQALLNEGTRVILPIVLGIVVGGAVLAVIFTLFYRFGVRIPVRRLFAVTSVLLYYMAFVFMGKGIRELQEGNVVSITIIPGGPHVELLGLYPTVETLVAQLVLVVLFVFALVKTFWPKRSVALPTIPSDPTATALVEAQLAEMRASQDELRKKIAALEAALARETSSSR